MTGSTAPRRRTRPARATLLVLAGALAGALPIAAQSDPELATPTVAPDGRVTFLRVAPEARGVYLFLEGSDPLPMARREDGAWSLTTDPLDPNLYAYYFRIDGVPADDPLNPMVLPMIDGGRQGLVRVPGPDSLLWERGDEPRGAVEAVDYRSDVIGEDRRALVYLPPGYRSDRPDGYPVLYLLHGVMNDEASWTVAGLADVLFDNLLALDRLAEPTIVVMPLGYGFPNPEERATDLLNTFEHREPMETFRESLVHEIVPEVQARYAARDDRESRAVAGLSMGGAQALFIGLRHPEVFGWIGSMSGAFMIYAARFEEWLGPARDIPPAERPRIWITTGTRDFVLGANRQVAGWLDENGIEAEYRETPGRHTWLVWKRALVELAPMLFRR